MLSLDVQARLKALDTVQSACQVVDEVTNSMFILSDRIRLGRKAWEGWVWDLEDICVER